MKTHIVLQKSLSEATTIFQREVNRLLTRERSKYGNTFHADLTEEEKANISEQFLSPMETLAHQLFFGGYLETKYTQNGTHITKQIYLSKIEFYLHECGENGIIKDFGMYHIPDFAKTYVASKLPKECFEGASEEDRFYLTPFPVGALHSHSSGIDITLDDKDNRFRASVLIRGYVVEGKYDGRSTYLYDQLLMGASVFNEGLSIKWVDELKRDNAIKEIRNGPRQNLTVKVIENHQKKDTGCKDTRKWQFYINE